MTAEEALAAIPLQIRPPAGDFRLLDEVEDALVVGDGDARILFVNRSLEALVGVERETLHGDAMERLMPSGPWESYRARGYNGGGWPRVAGLTLLLACARGATVHVDVRLSTVQRGRAMIIGLIRRKTG